MSWWCISSESLQEMLSRVADGEDPWLVYAEYYANSAREDYTDAEETEAGGD